MNGSTREVSLKHYVEINPLTDEFKILSENEEVTFLPLENIWSGGKTDYSTKRPWKKSDTSYTQFRRGDVLVPKVTPTVFHGRSTVAETETEVGLATSEVHVLRPKKGVEAKWVAYNVLSSQFLDRARGEVYGVGGLQRISAGYLGSYKVMETDLVNQQRIADYLDVETAQIDTTVSTLDELIEEMKSRRVQLIDNTIKLSGYPETPMKYIVNNRFAGEWGTAEGDSEVDLPCIRVADFDRSTNTVSDDVPTTRSVKRNVAEKKRLFLHDILLEKSGGGEKTPVGTPILYTGGDNAICSNFIEVIRLNPGHEPRYWVYALAGSYESGSTRRLINQTTGIQNVDLQLYFDESFPVPPVEKQVELADFLDIETAKIDKIVSTATELRSELLARRSALITEVVTGQRKV